MSTGLAGTAWPSPASLVEWEAPEACPGAARVCERLAATLGCEPQSLGKLSRVRGVVVPHAAGYPLSLEVFEDGRCSSRWGGRRRLLGSRDAAVLASGWRSCRKAALQDRSRKRRRQRRLAAAGECAGAGVRPPRGVAAGDRADARHGSLGAVLALGALPDPALGLSFSAGDRSPVLSVAAYGRLFESRRLAARPGGTWTLS